MEMIMSVLLTVTSDRMDKFGLVSILIVTVLVPTFFMSSLLSTIRIKLANFLCSELCARTKFGRLFQPI